jgi:hypothetical protein
VSRAALVLALLLLLVGCGSSGGEEGAATLWVTRDRGATVLYEGQVEAGVTVMQALRSRVEVETRYGGRFVQEIEGVAGSLDEGSDWFYFVNGHEADRGAAEYRVRPGDVVWWDHRRWGEEPPIRVVVGAFPEPFLHGYDGERRSTAVRYAGAGLRDGAEALGRLVEAESVAPVGEPVPQGWNRLLVLGGGPLRLVDVSERHGYVTAGDPVAFELRGDGAELARDPSVVHFRFEVP